MTRVPLLEIRGLTAHAGDAASPLLEAISLTVPAGSVTAVVGPSGAGKTTLGLAALAASRAGVRLEGEVRLEGTELLALDETRRRALRSGTAGHLPQHPEQTLDPVRRIGGALTELSALRGHMSRAERAATVRWALARAGLPEPGMPRRLPHQLSGGQQQRVALASALVTGAKLLVLDEPTSSLDPVTAHTLIRTLRSLTRDGAGLLLLSHDLSLVRSLATRVTVLEKGRTVQQGPVHEVLAHPVDEVLAHPVDEVLAHPDDPSRHCPRARAHPLTLGLLSAERRNGRTHHVSSGTGTGTASAAPVSPAHLSTAPHSPSPGRPPEEGVTATDVTVRRRTGSSPLPVPVTMSFPPGSRTALTGPSGAGKTTFGRLLAGLTPASTGTLTWGGDLLPRRLERRTPAQLRAVQYVHQASAGSFETHRPLLGQLAAAGPLLRGITEDAAGAEARALAHEIGLDDALLARTPAKLSGGQLQRCALIRALMARPALLVCDEITSGLDVMTREAVLDALPGLLAPARTALLLISHDLDAARRTAQSVAVFDDGRCVRHTSLPDHSGEGTPRRTAPTD